MTSPISGSTGGTNPLAIINQLNGTTASSGDSATKSKTAMDKDLFLKLLVAQLKYQDPSKPADATQFLAQTAQFTQVEKLGQIADMIKAQQLIGASSMVGRTVTYQDANGATQTGVVSKTKLNGDSEPTLLVGNTDVPLSKVTEVQQTAPATAATSGTPTTKDN
jgi:flagellar basal-body rod modification protein FlgD